jgi:hypothetical protein
LFENFGVTVYFAQLFEAYLQLLLTYMERTSLIEIDRTKFSITEDSEGVIDSCIGQMNRESPSCTSLNCLKRFRNAFITNPHKLPLHSQTFRKACITNLRNPPLRSLSPRRSRSQTRRPVELTSGVDKNKRGSREKTPILPLEFYS